MLNVSLGMDIHSVVTMVADGMAPDVKDELFAQLAAL
jgi:hypothetical protein